MAQAELAGNRHHIKAQRGKERLEQRPDGKAHRLTTHRPQGRPEDNDQRAHEGRQRHTLAQEEHRQSCGHERVHVVDGGSDWRADFLNRGDPAQSARRRAHHPGEDERGHGAPMVCGARLTPTTLLIQKPASKLPRCNPRWISRVAIAEHTALASTSNGGIGDNVSSFRVLRRSAGGQRDVLRQMALAMTGAQDSSVPAQVYRPRQEALPSRRENMTRLTTLCQRCIV